MLSKIQKIDRLIKLIRRLQSNLKSPYLESNNEVTYYICDIYDQIFKTSLTVDIPEIYYIKSNLDSCYWLFDSSAPDHTASIPAYRQTKIDLLLLLINIIQQPLYEWSDRYPLDELNNNHS